MKIGDIPLPTQAKILRVLQERNFQRVGGEDKITGQRARHLRHQSRSRRSGPEQHVPSFAWTHQKFLESRNASNGVELDWRYEKTPTDNLKGSLSVLCAIAKAALFRTPLIHYTAIDYFSGASIVGARNLELGE